MGLHRTAIGAANMEFVFITLLHKGSPVAGADACSVNVLKPIEDKILQLQERKRALAKDLITDDTGFVKTLTRADVEYLFS